MQAPRLNAAHAAAVFAVVATIGTIPAGALAAQTATSGAKFIQVASLAPLPVRATANRADRDVHPAWRGTVTAAHAGNVTLTLERIGAPESPFDPSWPVMVRWEYDAPDPSKSFTAQLYGMGELDGSMTLYGVVNRGYNAGQAVAVTVHGGSSGTALMTFTRDGNAP